MRKTEIIMGMPVTVEICGADEDALENIFDYFRSVDERLSPYKATSEVSLINDGKLSSSDYSPDMREILSLASATKEASAGYFDVVTPDGTFDPSGLVKGWAIQKAADRIRKNGYENFWVDAGADVQTGGVNERGQEWRIGICNPFNAGEIVKVLYPRGAGVATSGTYLRGKHIYDPHSGKAVSSDTISLTVLGKNVYEADRFATAAFAMGSRGIDFIELQPGLEAYSIDRLGRATLTSGFHAFTERPVMA